MQSVQFLIGLLCMFLFFGCSGSHESQYNLNKKWAAPELKEDLAILQQILEKNHPSLYWYSSKEKMDSSFAETIHGITDSLRETDFRNRLAALVSQIHCGHTVVLNSKAFVKVVSKNRQQVFPLAIKTWGDSMVVMNNINPDTRNIQKGTIITSINGRSNKEILDSFFTYISVDGNIDSHKSQRISNNFGAWYKNIFGLDTSYLIGYIDSIGVERKQRIQNFNFPKMDKLKIDSLQKILSGYKIPTRKEFKKARRKAQMSLHVDDTTHTAYMHLGGFSMNGIQKFIRQSFRKIDKQQVQNLVIDLRDNGGGHIHNSTLLTRYVAKHPFKIADTVAAISRDFVGAKYIRQSFWFWFPLNFNTTKMKDGRYHYHRFEKIEYQPFSNHHFDGNIFLLQGPNTFSAATVFTGSLKGQSNVQIIGEESGGGYYGNSAIHIPMIVLPNSKIQVTLPLFRVVLNKDRPKGRGVIPDLVVLPNSYTIQQGVDLKMETIKKKIKDKR